MQKCLRSFHENPLSLTVQFFFLCTFFTQTKFTLSNILSFWQGTACRKWCVLFFLFFTEFVLFKLYSHIYVYMYKQTFAAVMQPLSGALGGKLQRIPGSLGVLAAGMEARIVREDGTEADFNEAGELWLRGNSVCMGYWNNTKATNETFVDGWLRTGDKFRIDEKENFWCVLNFSFFFFFFFV